MADVKRLYRSRSDRMFKGVCGGLAEYFGLDPILIRVVFVVSLFVGGIGLISYVLLWLFVPEEPREEPRT
jgi:phage shock protein C